MSANAKYKVVGPLPVANRTTGETLTEDDLAGLDVQFLIETGHIETTSKGREATETKPEGEK
jgi:hypothetical protein